MTRIHFRTLALTGLLALAPLVSSATTITECKTLIGTLQTTTAGTTFLGQNAAKDEAALMGKLGDASNKLDAAKLLDASQKVADYQAKLNQLFSSGKIDAASYTELSTGATGVQSCIAGIGK